MQMKLYDALLKEELLPMVDAAVHDLSVQRMPGSFLYECVQAVAGNPSGAASAGTMDELRRYNMELAKQLRLLGGKKDEAEEAKQRNELEIAQEQMRKLMAENELLRSAAAQNSSKLRVASREFSNGGQHQGVAARSIACVIS